MASVDRHDDDGLSPFAVYCWHVLIFEAAVVFWLAVIKLVLG